MKNGQGCYTVSEKAVKYTGIWQNNIMHGFCEIDYGTYRYIGYMDNGKLSGKGKIAFDNGYVMNGYYRNTVEVIWIV